MVVSGFRDIGVDGSWSVVVGTRPAVDAHDIGVDDADGDTTEEDGGKGEEEEVARMLPFHLLAHRGRVADAHRNILPVAVVVLRPVGEEDMRRLPYPDGMDSVDNVADMRNAVAESILVAPGLKVICAWLHFPEIAVVRTCS